jgi:hypothetical protein
MHTLAPSTQHPALGRKRQRWGPATALAQQACPHRHLAHTLAQQNAQLKAQLSTARVEAKEREQLAAQLQAQLGEAEQQKAGDCPGSDN